MSFRTAGTKQSSCLPNLKGQSAGPRTSQSFPAKIRSHWAKRLLMRSCIINKGPLTPRQLHHCHPGAGVKPRGEAWELPGL